jgi:hypothetical protein
MRSPRRKRARGLYYRPSRGWYADFRRFADVGGRLEALIPPGSNRATDDADLAASLYASRLEDLERARRDGALLGQRRLSTGRVCCIPPRAEGEDRQGGGSLDSLC